MIDIYNFNPATIINNPTIVLNSNVVYDFILISWERLCVNLLLYVNRLPILLKGLCKIKF